VNLLSNRRTIKICGKNYHFKFDPNKTGARFGSNSSSGDGVMVIGTHNRALGDCAERILHEVMEAVAVEDNKRFYNYRSNSNDPDYIFVFDHDYLCGYTHKIIDGIVSSGFFRVRDGRPKLRRRIKRDGDKTEVQ